METFEVLTLMLSFGMFVIAILNSNNKDKNS
ncbi:putative holin-like toxin [Rossellomorea aquimaris]|nr:putative holin-like toxin [Rossellomorea aquimaris]